MTANEPIDEQRTVGELVQQATQQLSELVRQEMHLARVEMKDKARHAGKGAGLFSGAAVVALYGGATLVAAIVLLLGLAIEPWIAALIVAVVLLAVAGVLAISGKHRIDDALPPAPEQAGDSVRDDIEYIKERAHR